MWDVHTHVYGMGYSPLHRQTSVSSHLCDPFWIWCQGNWKKYMLLILLYHMMLFVSDTRILCSSWKIHECLAGQLFCKSAKISGLSLSLQLYFSINIDFNLTNQSANKNLKIYFNNWSRKINRIVYFDLSQKRVKIIIRKY